MNSSAIVHISKPAGVKSGFYKCGHGMYPVDQWTRSRSNQGTTLKKKLPKNKAKVP